MISAQWPLLKTNSRSITKIDRRVPHDTCYIVHQFKGQKVKGQGHTPTNTDTQNVPYLPNGKAKDSVRMEDYVDLHQQQVP